MTREAIALLLGYLQNQRAIVQRVLSQIRSLDTATEERTVTLAYYLHNLYSAVEDLFEEVASTFENRVEDTSAYHRELLQRMSIEVPTIRPRLLSAPSTALLDELRAFRHVFRHTYSYSLDPDRIANLREKVLAGWETVEEDMARFEEFLKEQLQT